jgi:hypothetical protein
LDAQKLILKKGQKLQVKFKLIMDGLLVMGNWLDRVIIEWEEEADEVRVQEIANEWLTTRNYLTQRMLGLHSVAEASLTIEPQE